MILSPIYIHKGSVWSRTIFAPPPQLTKYQLNEIFKNKTKMGTYRLYDTKIIVHRP